MGMPHVTRTEILVSGFLFRQGHVHSSQGGLDKSKKLVESRGFAEGDVKDLVERRWIAGGCGQQIGLDYIFNETEIAAGFTVTVNFNRPLLEQRRDPAWNHGSVRAGRILPRTENIEVAQTNAGQTERARENAGIDLID